MVDIGITKTEFRYVSIHKDSSSATSRTSRRESTASTWLRIAVPDAWTCSITFPKWWRACCTIHKKYQVSQMITHFLYHKKYIISQMMSFWLYHNKYQYASFIYIYIYNEALAKNLALKSSARQPQQSEGLQCTLQPSISGLSSSILKMSFTTSAGPAHGRASFRGPESPLRRWTGYALIRRRDRQFRHRRRSRVPHAQGSCEPRRPWR